MSTAPRHLVRPVRQAGAAAPDPSLASAARPCHILLYIRRNGERVVRRTAKIFMSNRSQAVRLPREFRFETREVFIRKVGDEIILSPRPADWSAYLAEGPVASAEFMAGVEDLPVQEREP